MAAIIIVGAAVALPLSVMSGNRDATGATTLASRQTVSTSLPVNTTVGAATSSPSSTAGPSTVVAGGTAPGDSGGSWAEVTVPGAPAEAWAVCVSEQALLMDAKEGDNNYSLYAYMFDTGKTVKLPIEGNMFLGEDLDGLLAVWWEGDYDETTGDYSNEHVYAYVLPDGPKVDIAGGGEAVSYPQVATPWITWVEGEPWERNPEEYFYLRVYGVQVDEYGKPSGGPIELVSGATAFTQSDTFWVYSLSNDYLAWEQAAAADALQKTGTYSIKLAGSQPAPVGAEAWRPSIGGSKVVYFQDGLKAADLATGAVQDLDREGDFATAGDTFTAYYRSTETDGQQVYEIVARGYATGYEQVLGQQSDSPSQLPLVSVSQNHVAFVTNEQIHLFEWRAGAQSPDMQ